MTQRSVFVLRVRPDKVDTYGPGGVCCVLDRSQTRMATQIQRFQRKNASCPMVEAAINPHDQP
jgi:hypothetical protein